MARAYNSTLVKNNPIDIYGLRQETDDSDLGSAKSVFVTIMYEREYESLPLNNLHGLDNGVHWCTRADPEMQKQMIEFVNTGNFTTVCVNDHCQRDFARC